MAGHSDTNSYATDGTRREFLKSAGVTGALVGTVGTELWLVQGGQAQEIAATFLLGGRIEGWEGVAPEEIAGATNPTLPVEPGQTYRLLWQNLDGAAHNLEIQNERGTALEVLLPLEVNQDEVAQLFDQGGQAPANVSVANATDVPANGTTQPANETGNATANGTGMGGPQEGQLVETTELIAQQNAVQAVEFTATEEMAQYICPVHPTSMVGDVELGGGAAGGNASSR